MKPSKSKVAKPKGFAAIILKNPEKQRKIASMGGKTVAKKLGPSHMAKIGRKGGRRKSKNEEATRRSKKIKRFAGEFRI